MQPWLVRIATRAVALIVMCAVAVVTLPTATAATITCCCGEHDAHSDCGCVDCPAGHAAGDAGDTPSLKRCQSRAAVIVLANADLAPPPVVTDQRELARTAALQLLPHPDDRAADPPPSPPPRA